MNIGEHVETFFREGYLIVREYLEPARVGRLLRIAESAIEQWKRESTQEGEPGGFSFSPQATFLFHLNHPKYFRGRLDDLAFLLDAVADPFPQAIMRAILNEEPYFEQASLFLHPENGEENFGAWHRDAQFFAGGDEERERRSIQEEAVPAREVHFHIPLVKSVATQVVPGSHLRWDTEEERGVRFRQDPFNETMPNGVVLEIDPGDIAFFHVNALHRGTYPKGYSRRTIHCTYGRASIPRPATRERIAERNGHYSTYQPWFKEPSYLAGVRPETHASFGHFIRETEQYWTRDGVADLPAAMQRYFWDY